MVFHATFMSHWFDSLFTSLCVLQKLGSNKMLGVCRLVAQREMNLYDLHGERSLPPESQKHCASDCIINWKYLFYYCHHIFVSASSFQLYFLHNDTFNFPEFITLLTNVKWRQFIVLPHWGLQRSNSVSLLITWHLSASVTLQLVWLKKMDEGSFLHNHAPNRSIVNKFNCGK